MGDLPYRGGLLGGRRPELILSVCPDPCVDTFMWVDDVALNAMNHAAREERFPGGKGVRTALGCTELGSTVRLIGAWAGPAGKWLKETLGKSKIVCLGPEVKGWNRTCVNLVSKEPGTGMVIRGTGPTLSSADLEGMRVALRNLLPDASCVVLGGSWPQGVPGDAYAGMLEDIEDSGKPAFLDACGGEFGPALEAGCHSIHLTMEDAARILGCSSPSSAVQKLGSHCHLAVVSVGSGDAYFSCDGRSFLARIPGLETHGGFGSSDFLVSGLAVSCERRASIQKAARFALACACASAAAPVPGLLSKSEVSAMEDRVESKDI